MGGACIGKAPKVYGAGASYTPSLPAELEKSWAASKDGKPSRYCGAEGEVFPPPRPPHAAYADSSGAAKAGALRLPTPMPPLPDEPMSPLTIVECEYSPIAKSGDQSRSDTDSYVAFTARELGGVSPSSVLRFFADTQSQNEHAVFQRSRVVSFADDPSDDSSGDEIPVMTVSTSVRSRATSYSVSVCTPRSALSNRKRAGTEISRSKVVSFDPVDAAIEEDELFEENRMRPMVSEMSVPPPLVLGWSLSVSSRHSFDESFHVGLGSPVGMLNFERDYKAGETLGEGSYGRVFAARHQATGKIFAIKEVIIHRRHGNNAAEEEAGMERISRELSLCGQLRHPNIVRFIGYDLPKLEDCSRRCALLFLEFCSGGSMSSHMDAYGPCSKPLLQKYSRQLLDGVEYLHSKHVAHRDLKCANLLLDYDADLKVADFGCSVRICNADAHRSESGDASRVVGTVLWTAPELLKGGSNGSDLLLRADIWSVGCCLVEMASAKPPWSECLFDNVFAAWRTIAGTEQRPLLSPEAPEDVVGLTSACLLRDPAKRSSAADLRRSVPELPPTSPLPRASLRGDPGG
eukprot:TRINITY_DN1174_c0_g3_i2.p1 TRINITY_DN1174_c0_g3~~TRINITY_DN1174_c0_g3_i2.p1  ORF type:complete len:575 (+),score=106.09 TRINITY_DN1174_c0_g3_i2:77-1801(+)